MSKLSIDKFNRTFGADYAEFIGVERAFRVYHYWAVCGYADMKDKVEMLSKYGRKELLLHIVNNYSVTDNTMDARACNKIVNAIINSL